MKRRFIPAGLISILLVASNLAFAEKKLPDDQYRAFLQESKIEPGNLAKDQELIRKLSNPQLREVVKSFNVGHYGFLHPMRIEGKELPDLLGRKFKELSVMAVWDEKLKPIPFQFDEFDSKNHYIYIPDVNKSPIDGTHLKLDPNDLLIFMYRDAGAKAFNPQTMKLSEGKILKELKINDANGNTRYAYLVENNSQRSTADYINVDLEKSKIVSSYYHIEYDPNNFLNFKDVRPYVGTAADQRIIDNIYFELSANLSSLFRVGMNSARNVRIKVLGVKDGPVRTTALIKIVIVLNGIVPVFSMNSEISFYEQGLVMPNRTEVGKGAMFVKIFQDPEILMYIDMNGLAGGRVSAQAFTDENGKRLYGLIDGKMDAEEQQAVDAGLPGDWTWIESGQGWDIFMTFQLPMEHLEGMTLRVFFNDDINDTTSFETFPGAGPKIGMVLNGLPNDMKAIESLDMEYSFWFPDTVGEKGPEGFNNEAVNPPKAEIRDLK